MAVRGVHAPEMRSILQFMYLGQATFYQDKMNDFLNVARSLEIKEIGKDVECKEPDSPKHEENDKNIEFNILQEENTIESQSNLKVKNEHKTNNVISHRNEAGQFLCNRCDKIFTLRRNLNRHIESAHEGIKYPCNDCRHEFTTEQSLKAHIQYH